MSLESESDTSGCNWTLALSPKGKMTETSRAAASVTAALYAAATQTTSAATVEVRQTSGRINRPSDRSAWFLAR
jgi:hypothetical protein